ncbi:hypothetical protein B296_00012627 [Ensete ventricosum]|uniref:Reverse transcriptase domain-containing protein n=1 Tax=Ensete ventricosum TaxID=4639 RepID=A0A426ZF48_ENSVE|nr:hypothetical protein B296_00012627 [Ensete ventricosum]
MKTRSEERDRKCYYRFHRDYDHDTKECYDLKNQIEYLICRGHLDRFIRKPGKPSLHLKGPVERQIDVIVGGLTSKSEYLDHDDALVITARIANALVKRTMIDTGSSIDILYFDTYLKLGMTNQDLNSMTSILTWLSRDTITPAGIATLLMTFSDEPRTKTLMVPFMVVELLSAYNMIIG